MKIFHNSFKRLVFYTRKPTARAAGGWTYRRRPVFGIGRFRPLPKGITYVTKCYIFVVTNRYNKVKVMRLVGLKEIRKQRGLNQQKVAMDLHITREALSQYENGKREPGQKMLIRMSEYFNVSIHYLITGHEFQKKHPDPPGH